MPWIQIAVWLAAGVVTLVLVVRGKRPFDVHDLGSVSHYWIAAHRGD
jgi:hypothetical protein